MSRNISVRPVIVALLPYMVKGFDVETRKPVIGFPYVLAKETEKGIGTLNCILELSLEDGEIPADIAETYALCIPNGEFHVVFRYYKFLYVGPDGMAHFEDDNDTDWN